MGGKTMAKRRRPPTGGDPRASYEELLKLAGEASTLGNLPIPDDSISPHEFVGDGLAWYVVGCLATHPDGWMRWTSDAEGKTLYLKFKWSGGPLKNRYVMAVVQWWQIKYGVQLLYAKVNEAEQHNGKGSAKDTFYDWQDGRSTQL